jgi:lipooligosaccharide transport system permease protein
VTTTERGAGRPGAGAAPDAGRGVRPLPPALRWYPALEFWLRAYRRSWRGSVFSSFVAPLLYLGSLGYGLGGLVDAGTGDGVGAGVAYAVYVAPGILTANAMQTAIGESTYAVHGAVKWQRQYLAMLATPLTVVDVLFGHVAYLVLRVVLATVAFVLVGALLGAFTSGWVVVAALVAVLCGVVHALPVMAFAVGAETDSGFTMIFRFGVVPMFLFAGTFFPVDQLPALMQPVAWATPLWHATELSRGLALGTAEWGSGLAHLGYLVAWLVVGGWLAVRCYTRRLAD